MYFLFLLRRIGAVYSGLSREGTFLGPVLYMVLINSGSKFHSFKLLIVIAPFQLSGLDSQNIFLGP